MNNFDFTALKERLTYCHESGVFTWKIRVSSRAASGAIAGNLMNTGYWHITVHGKKFLAHRLAWVFYHGVWPSKQIDHINGNRLDNRISNLREVTCKENLWNRHFTGGKNPYVGVSAIKGTTLWQAHIGFNGKQKNLGRYATAEEARAVYLEAKKIYHPISSH